MDNLRVNISQIDLLVIAGKKFYNSTIHFRNSLMKDFSDRIFRLYFFAT